MIRHVEHDDPRLALDSIVGHPLVAVAIAGRAACPQVAMDFWVSLNDDSVTAWLCRSGTSFYITGDSSAAHEMAQFICTLGYDMVLTDLELPLGDAEPMIAVEWQGEAPILPELPDDCRLVYLTEQSNRLSVVDFAALQLASGALESTDEADSYAVSLSHSVRKGRAGAVAIVRDGRVVAGAAANYIGNKRSILAAVAVQPDCRRQGFATAIVTAGAALSMQLAARPYLCCRRSLLDLYVGAGFTPIAPLRQYRKELNSQ